MNELKQTAELMPICFARTALLPVRSFYQPAQH